MIPRKLQNERFEDEKYFFRVQQVGWKIVGFWPGMDNVPTRRIALAIANSIHILVYGCFQMLYCYERLDDLVIFLDALSPVLTQATTAMKVLTLVAMRKDLKWVLDHLKQSFYNGKGCTIL